MSFLPAGFKVAKGRLLIIIKCRRRNAAVSVEMFPDAAAAQIKRKGHLFMKNWIVQQGWGMYLMIGMAIAGVIGSILCRIFYGRLAREAQLCGTSDYPMLHYIRQKYTSYYKLGMHPSNAGAIVRRYLALHKAGPLTLNAWRYVSVLMMAGILLDGLIVSIYRYQQAYEAGPSIVYAGTSLILALGVWMVSLVLGVKNQYRISENAVCDYLENYLKSKLDGEYGYGHQVETPDNYERALRETAAARTGSAAARPVSGRQEYTRASGNSEYRRRQNGRELNRSAGDDPASDAVDARIVEDVLKEFLC